MNSKYEVLDRTKMYEGFFTLESLELRHTLFRGGWSKPLKRELFRRGTCVAVLLYDPVLDRVVMIEQFRVGAILHSDSPWLLEIVAGAVEEGETAEDVARREVMEEAGCQVQCLREIQKFYTTPGGSSEWLTLFCGWVDSRNVECIAGLEEEGEDIRVFSMGFSDVYQALQTGKIISAIPIIAIQWLYIHRTQLRNEWLDSPSVSTF